MKKDHLMVETFVLNFEQLNNLHWNEINSLRYRVIHQKLNWLLENEQLSDFDRYDEIAVHVFVTVNNKIVGYARLVDGTKAMLFFEDSFRSMFVDDLKHFEEVSKESVEVSRLVLEPTMNNALRALVFFHLIKTIEQQVQLLGKSMVIAVTMEKMMVALEKAGYQISFASRHMIEEKEIAIAAVFSKRNV